jgi:DNA invertase Pin-like site-specific DNA recombinase
MLWFMNIITYLRVSTDGQDHEPQRMELNGWIERNGFTAVGEFSDTISGAKAARPGLDALMEKCRAGCVDAVAVVKLDRLGRSVINVVTLIADLEKMGVAVICTSQGIDTRESNPCGKMQYQIIAAVAEFEREIIRERTRAGLAVARKNGKVLGRPSKTLIPAAERKAVVDVWLASGRTGGLRGLAAALGGCSPSTASKVLAQIDRT